MSDTLTEQSRPTPPPARSKRFAALAVAVVVAIAAVILGIALTRGGPSAGAAQLTATQQACQQWHSGYTPAAGDAPTTAWCSAMTDWMRAQLRSGHTSTAMMWGNAAAMASVCRQWMSTGQGGAAGVNPQVCDDMVAWMTSHVGNWNRWMTAGHMMGQ
jgi:hypothetical protein